MFVGIDPGKYGAFSLVDPGGVVVALWPMPLDGGQPCRVGIAEVYREIRDRLAFASEPHIFIEKIYTPPTDAMAKETVKKLVAMYTAMESILGQQLTRMSSDGSMPGSMFIELTEAFEKVGDVKATDLRVDGRVGLLNYSRGAGLLEMAAMWGWPIQLVPPGTWCRKMKVGVDKSTTTKEQSISAAKGLWPKMFDKANELHFFPGRKTKPDEGMVEATLIAEYGRRLMMDKSDELATCVNS